ncbi:DUF934 domain-containing protein [Methylomonas sp. LL1]|uniref:DUF934 domain-containing protein n=1 Tax=Methylomonas sp. LL1 TaxID=2785785 RepID=UPI0018C3E820|nr:DUF934 domain-containing protein [Methylomonas sp. LL1]QPK62522.1 DUF934 domain-containing protein [Methylomonas sp. LL1]CAG1020633.1 hypothetical protein MTYM_00408 [Methylococcales bacterium]
MPIIKNQQISENTWTFVADESPLTSGDITVSLKRWTENKDQLLEHAGAIGVRLAPNESVELLADDLSSISLVELEFPVFTDGRSFSQARLLRDRFGYQGEIRAVGNFLTDQVFYLRRVGVDAFDINQPRDIELALAALNDFSVKYQASSN